MKSFLSVFLCLFSILFTNAQNITGKVYDGSSGEALIGATVTLNDKFGAITNIDGEFSINSEKGEFNIQVSGGTGPFEYSGTSFSGSWLTTTSTSFNKLGKEKTNPGIIEKPILSNQEATRENLTPSKELANC